MHPVIPGLTRTMGQPGMGHLAEIKGTGQGGAILNSQEKRHQEAVPCAMKSPSGHDVFQVPSTWPLLFPLGPTIFGPKKLEAKIPLVYAVSSY